MRKRRFIANVFIMAGSMLLIRLVGMGANIYITARLGAKAMGIYHMLLSVFTFGITFAGAGVGILSARIGYWMLPYTKRMMHRLTGWDVFVTPTASVDGAGINAVVRF
jgi:hypothetical protein